MFDRFEDPGAGAVSYHMGRDFVALRDIEANEEVSTNLILTSKNAFPTSPDLGEGATKLDILTIQ